jgi:hypothetical protein
MAIITFLFLWRAEMFVWTVPSMTFLVLVYVLGFIWYFAAVGINKAKGVDTNKVLGEIPQD